jgi:hypothetical protein
LRRDRPLDRAGEDLAHRLASSTTRRSFIGVIGSEFILSSGGLGYRISFSYNNFQSGVMYGLILFVLAVGLPSAELAKIRFSVVHLLHFPQQPLVGSRVAQELKPAHFLRMNPHLERSIRLYRFSRQQGQQKDNGQDNQHRNEQAGRATRELGTAQPPRKPFIKRMENRRQDCRPHQGRQEGLQDAENVVQHDQQNNDKSNSAISAARHRGS